MMTPTLLAWVTILFLILSNLCAWMAYHYSQKTVQYQADRIEGLIKQISQLLSTRKPI